MFAEQEIVLIKTKDQDASFYGTVRYINEQYVVLICGKEALSQCPAGTPLVMTQVIRKQVRQFETRVARQQERLLIVERPAREQSQRRRSRRLLCDLDVSLTLADRRADAPKRYGGQAQDLSLGGLSLTLAAELAPDTPVHLEIETPEGAPLQMEGYVLRCTASDAWDSPAYACYQAAIRFTYMTRINQLRLVRLSLHNHLLSKRPAPTAAH